VLGSWLNGRSHLTLTRIWRVVSIEPRQPVPSDLPSAGAGQLAAVLELVID
jgi:hypothetical protein